MKTLLTIGLFVIINLVTFQFCFSQTDPFVHRIVPIQLETLLNQFRDGLQLKNQWEYINVYIEKRCYTIYELYRRN